MSDKTRICFVCLGNIVRSPLAENLFRHYLKEYNLDHEFEVDSAGTSGWHVGEPPDPRMQRVASRMGVAIKGRSRQFRRKDFDRFDLILAMDSSNLQALRDLASHDQALKIRLLREYDPQAGPNSSVPDPYYGGVNGFEEVYHIIDRSVRGLIESLVDESLSKET